MIGGDPKAQPSIIKTKKVVFNYLSDLCSLVSLSHGNNSFLSLHKGNYSDNPFF